MATNERDWALAFCEAWNTVAKASGMRGCVPAVRARDAWTKRQILRCMELSDDLAGWEAGFRLVGADPFFSGQNARGWKADLEYALRDKNIARILESGMVEAEEQKAREAGRKARGLDVLAEHIDAKGRLERGEF